MTRIIEGDQKDWRLRHGWRASCYIPSIYVNATHFNTAAIAEIAPALILTKVSRAEKTIARLNARQAKLDAEKQKAVQALANAQRSETMEAGQKEFVRAVETLDPSTREAVVTQVLESLKDGPRVAKIQAWMALIPTPEPRNDSSQENQQAERKSEPEPTLALTSISK